ncbi:MAG TPA: hypothetical protein VKT33_10000 [Candidatus Angelobacter sp.]|nr:hypothetical protein [Candidatus Angelobacter sp.]
MIPADETIAKRAPQPGYPAGKCLNIPGVYEREEAARFAGEKKKATIRGVLRYTIIAIGLAAGVAAAQQEPAPAQEKPQVRLNYLNVCTPTVEDQTAIKDALAKGGGKPAFIEDFEVSRGRTTPKDSPPAKFVRLRRDFSAQSPMITAQYSMSTDEENTIETLVLRMRDTKELYEISIEDRVSSSAASPVAIIATDTPASRVRIERLGKSSIVLARCEGADQSAYEPLFQRASELMTQYRRALGLRTTFHSDIAWLGGSRKNTGGSGQSAPHVQKQH